MLAAISLIWTLIATMVLHKFQTSTVYLAMCASVAGRCSVALFMSDQRTLIEVDEITEFALQHRANAQNVVHLIRIVHVIVTICNVLRIAMLNYSRHILEDAITLRASVDFQETLERFATCRNCVQRRARRRLSIAIVAL